MDTAHASFAQEARFKLDELLELFNDPLHMADEHGRVQSVAPGDDDDGAFRLLLLRRGR